MKRIFVCSLALLLIIGCSKSKNDLFKETDSFVESLATTYERYSIFGSDKDTRITPDGLYRVMPEGRLINVRIEKEVSDAEYEKLRSDLEQHYKGDTRVNKVYICNAGTIMIDCRN